MTVDVPSALGWIGMGMLLIAYWRRDRLPPVAYALLNLVGAGLIAVVCFVQAAWPAFALECAWAVIAVRDLVRPR
jgi:hypothetical protein